MSYDQIQTACVIHCPYQRAREARLGETESREDRPVAVGVRTPRPDGALVLFLPVTTKQPEASRFAAEMPDIEKRRAGLDTDRRLWIIVDDFNTDVVDRSFYLEPDPPTGRFSKAFFLPLLGEFIARGRTSTEVNPF